MTRIKKERRIGSRAGLHAAVAAAAIAATFAQPAMAQSQSSDDQKAATPATSDPASDQANDIVVTAQFRGQKLQDTPLAITALTGDELTARGETSITDLGRTAPNVNLAPATGLNGSSVTAFIRGIGQSDSSFALEPGVGIYIDDVYYGTTYGAVMDLTDLDRVEVLRGPQGTLAGKNSLGGAIKLFSAKPDADAGGFVEGTYGRFDRVDLRGQTIGRGQALLTLGQGDLPTRLATAGLFAQMRYDGPADTLWRLTGVELFDLSGPVAIAADVTGRVADPQIRGVVQAKGARIESATTGTVLTNIQASGRFVGSRLAIQQFAADAGKGGRVSGTGQFEFAAQDVPDDDPLRTTLTALLLEHARRSDEAGR